jgi:hypothetical protein
MRMPLGAGEISCSGVRASVMPAIMPSPRINAVIFFCNFFKVPLFIIQSYSKVEHTNSVASNSISFIRCNCLKIMYYDSPDTYERRVG